MSTGLKANSDGSAAIQVGGTDVITLTSGGAATFVTSPTTVQAGTAAAPSITFSGDTNTGIYSPGADQVAIATGGTAAIYANSSQNVGIGTTSPTAVGNYTVLQLTGKSTGQGGLIRLETSDGTSGVMRMYAGSTEGVIEVVSNDPLLFSTNATERARFNTTGALVFAGGTTTADGIGITFPATQSASSNANTLDDYEEGNWTPLIQGSTTAGVSSYTVQEGRYTKIGRQVTVTFYVDLTSATGTGALQIAGLPFTTSSTNQSAGALMTDRLNWTNATSPVCYSGNNSTVMQIWLSQDDGAWIQQQVVNEAFGLIGCLTYFVA